MTDEIINGVLYQNVLLVEEPITATDIAEMSWANFADMCSATVVALMKNASIENGVKVTLTVETPAVVVEEV